MSWASLKPNWDIFLLNYMFWIIDSVITVFIKNWYIRADRNRCISLDFAVCQSARRAIVNEILCSGQHKTTTYFLKKSWWFCGNIEKNMHGVMITFFLKGESIRNIILRLIYVFQYNWTIKYGVETLSKTCLFSIILWHYEVYRYFFKDCRHPI